VIAGTSRYTETDQLGQLSATYTAGGVSEDVTVKATWSVANPDVAKISSTGQVRAYNTGQTTVTASYQGISAAYTVRIDLPLIDLSGAHVLRVTASSTCSNVFRYYPSQGADRSWLVTVKQSNQATNNIEMNVESSLGLQAMLVNGRSYGTLRGDKLEITGNSIVFDDMTIFGRYYAYVLNGTLSGRVNGTVVTGTVFGQIWYEDAHCDNAEHPFTLTRR
jgi:Bacterial Ig-like domain (group 2)